MFTCGPAFFGGVAVSSDPYFQQVVLLCHFDALNNTQAIDSSSRGRGINIISRSLSTTQKKFGASSGTSGATGQFYLSDSPDWDFGSGAFTVELHAFFTVAPGTNRKMFVGQWQGTTGLAWLLQMTSGNLSMNLSTTGAGTTHSAGAAWAPVLNTWYHLAATRDAAGNLRIFVDGILKATSAAPVTITNSTLDLTFGGTFNGGLDGFDGYIDELRITKGIARYTSDFTPPSSAYPNF